MRADCDNCKKQYILGDAEYCEVNSKDTNCLHYDPIEPDDYYKDVKNQMLHDGVCKEDVDHAIAIIKRLRGEE